MGKITDAALDAISSGDIKTLVLLMGLITFLGFSALSVQLVRLWFERKLVEANRLPSIAAALERVAGAQENIATTQAGLADGQREATTALQRIGFEVGEIRTDQRREFERMHGDLNEHITREEASLLTLVTATKKG